YEKLNNNLGKFVNLGDNEDNVYIDEFDTVYPYPKNVGIIINNRNGSTDEQFLLAAKQRLLVCTSVSIINNRNGSTDEQFLLAAKQSKKVKLFYFVWLLTKT